MFASFVFAMTTAVYADIAVAQDLSTANTASEACETNTGLPGVLFAGQFNTFFPPKDFHTVHLSDWDGIARVYSTVSNGEITVYPNIRYEDQILVYSEENSEPEQRTSVAFHASDGEIVSSCFVEVVTLDTTIHDFSKTRLGYCEFGGNSDTSQLIAGAVELVDLPETFHEGATSSTRTLNYKPVVGGDQVELKGISEGLATFIWLGADKGDGQLKGLCPVVVLDGN